MPHSQLVPLIHDAVAANALPLDRRIYAMRETERRCRAYGLAEIAMHAALCVDRDRALLGLKNHVRRRLGTHYGPAVHARERSVRRLLQALDGYLNPAAVCLSSDHLCDRQAPKAHALLFPKGVNELFKPDVADTYFAVSKLLIATEQPAVVEIIATLDELGVILDELSTAVLALGAALQANRSLARRDEIQQREAEGQVRVAEVIGMIIDHVVRWNSDGIEDLLLSEPVEALCYLLNPLLDQNITAVQLGLTPTRATADGPLPALLIAVGGKARLLPQLEPSQYKVARHRAEQASAECMLQ